MKNASCEDRRQSEAAPHVLSALTQALRQRGQQGMSLVEVLIVLAIMASMAGIVGVFASRALEDSAKQEARIEVGKIDGMIQQFMIMSSPRALPETLEDLTKGNPPILSKLPQDPWGQDYVYRKTGNREYELFSKGSDEQEGTEDDIRKD